MSEDFLIWHFPEAGQVQRFLALVVLVVVALGVWFGRKHLNIASPIALIFLLLAAVAIPSAIPARLHAQRNACIYNLKTIQETKVRWTSERGNFTSDVPTEADLFGERKYIKHDIQCPRGGVYRIGSVAENPTCSKDWAMLKRLVEATKPCELESALADEERVERERDRIYWQSLKAELEQLRHAARKH